MLEIGCWKFEISRGAKLFTDPKSTPFGYKTNFINHIIMILKHTTQNSVYKQTARQVALYEVMHKCGCKNKMKYHTSCTVRYRQEIRCMDKEMIICMNDKMILKQQSIVILVKQLLQLELR